MNSIFGTQLWYLPLSVLTYELLLLLMVSCPHCGSEKEVIKEDYDVDTDSTITYFECGHHQRISLRIK